MTTAGASAYVNRAGAIGAPTRFGGTMCARASMSILTSVSTSARGKPGVCALARAVVDEGEAHLRVVHLEHGLEAVGLDGGDGDGHVEALAAVEPVVPALVQLAALSRRASRSYDGWNRTDPRRRRRPLAHAGTTMGGRSA